MPGLPPGDGLHNNDDDDDDSDDNIRSPGSGSAPVVTWSVRLVTPGLRSPPAPPAGDKLHDLDMMTSHDISSVGVSLWAGPLQWSRLSKRSEM